MGTTRTPGIYITEKDSFSNSVLEVATAIPAFIGYTEIAANGNISLRNKPFRITSLTEFHTYFGKAPIPQFALSVATGKETPDLVFGAKKIMIKRVGVEFNLYYQMQMFFSNGGEACYIVSVGDYKTKKMKGDDFIGGIETLVEEQEPTILLCPEAVQMKDKEACFKVQTAMLNHCGKIRNRIAILDIYDGYKSRSNKNCDVINEFRDNIESSFVDFGAAYYPWINTSIVQYSNTSYIYFNTEDLKVELEEELKKNSKEIQMQIKGLVDKIDTETDATAQEIMQQKLLTTFPMYRTILEKAMSILNLLPPSAAMAGIYTKVDHTRGVWKAPANVPISSAVSPAVIITQDEQEALCTHLSGKAINIICTLRGEEVLVWGARTLDSNSPDWRYINVRRTMIMLEESIKSAVRAYVNEPNVANTWVSIKSIIQNFLNEIWKRGGLAGATPDDAFRVCVGLGDTMTPKDITDGILRIKVLVAVARPADFIEITFQQQMQKK